LLESYTPIQPILIGDNQRALQVSAELQKRGFLVGAIRPPSVPQGEARLRVTLSALHGEKDVDALVGALAVACLDQNQTKAEA
jgi:8-amino-7-oxononanoate synthase